MGSNSRVLKGIKYPESLRKLSKFHSSIMCFSLKEEKEKKKIPLSQLRRAISEILPNPRE